MQCQSPNANGSHLCPECLALQVQNLDSLPLDSLTVIPWRTADEIEEQDVEWLWWNRIALGEVTLVGGDPGQGKSQFTAALTARITTGMPLPDGGENVKGSVVFASLEDHPNKTIRKRLRKQGADLKKVLIPDQFKDVNGQFRRLRTSDVPVLEMAVELQGDVKLLVLDPIMAFMGGKVDTNKDAEVRDILGPLAEMAQRQNIAVVIVAHLNKGDAANILYKISGSVGFAALPRSVLLIARQEETGRRGIAHIKSNLGPQMDSVEFTLDEDGFHWGQLAPELSAKRLVEVFDNRKTSDERDLAKEWLRDHLRAGPQFSEDIRKDSEECGIAWSTLGRAKRDMQITHHKVEAGKDAQGRVIKRTRWMLP